MNNKPGMECCATLDIPTLRAARCRGTPSSACTRRLPTNVLEKHLDYIKVCLMVNHWTVTDGGWCMQWCDDVCMTSACARARACVLVRACVPELSTVSRTVSVVLQLDMAAMCCGVGYPPQIALQCCCLQRIRAGRLQLGGLEMYTHRPDCCPQLCWPQGSGCTLGRSL